jgi:FtsH-binding integral membrane protein
MADIDTLAPAAPAYVDRSALVQSHLQRVFAWMFVGLGLTAAIAAWFATNGDMSAYFDDHAGVMFLLFGAELALVFGISLGINRMSAAVATFAFCLYAGLSGVTFSVLLEVYTAGSIVGAFAGATGLFAGMAIYGYVTKTDLTKLGPILFGALIGLIIASIAFLFTGGGVFNLVIGCAGVLIFSGLTAYDMQKIKEFAPDSADEDTQRRAAIIGALALYLDFVNLFLSLLRILGATRD